MYTNVTETTFRDSFMSLRPNNFSHEGLSVLFDFFEDLEQDTGEPMELDVIAICCDFSQDYYQDIIDNYRIPMEDLEAETDDEEQMAEAVLQWLNQETCVVGGVLEGNTIIYQVF